MREKAFKLREVAKGGNNFFTELPMNSDFSIKGCCCRSVHLGAFCIVCVISEVITGRQYHQIYPYYQQDAVGAYIWHHEWQHINYFCCKVFFFYNFVGTN